MIKGNKTIIGKCLHSQFMNFDSRKVHLQWQFKNYFLTCMELFLNFLWFINSSSNVHGQFMNELFINWPFAVHGIIHELLFMNQWTAVHGLFMNWRTSFHWGIYLERDINQKRGIDKGRGIYQKRAFYREGAFIGDTWYMSIVMNIHQHSRLLNMIVYSYRTYWCQYIHQNTDEYNPIYWHIIERILLLIMGITYHDGMRKPPLSVTGIIGL